MQSRSSKQKSNETSFISVNSDLPCARSSDPLSLPCHTPMGQDDAPFSKPFLPRLRWHPLSAALLLSSKVVSLVSSCLSVPHSPLVITSIALSPRALERMRSPDFLLQLLPQGPHDLIPLPFPLSSLPLAHCARHTPFLSLRHTLLVTAEGCCCSLCLEFSLLRSLYDTPYGPDLI